MKKKTMLTLGVCALALGAVVGAVSARSAMPVHAGTVDDGWYLTGLGGKWSPAESLAADAEAAEGDVATWTNVAITQYDKFKLAYCYEDAFSGDSWKGFDKVNEGGAKGDFKDYGGGDIGAEVGGAYDIHLLTESYTITIEAHGGSSSSSASSSESTESTDTSESEVPTGTGLYLRGTAVGGWDVAEANQLEEHGTDLGCILNVKFSVGDFKIANNDWSEQWGWLYKNTDEEYDHVTVIGGAKDNFEAGETDNNIHCAVAGFYDVYLTGNNYISIELHDQPTPIKDYFFVSTGNFGEGTKAYLATYDTDGEKDLPGVEINDTNFEGASCTEASNFNDMGGVWEIPTSLLKAKFIVTIIDSEEQVKAQTEEIDKADGLFIAPGATAEAAAGSIALAWQARLVKDTETAIRASTAESVCNVSKVAAQNLVDAYDELKIKAAYDKSTYWTYDPSQTYDEAIEADPKVMADVSYADIVEQLRVIAYPSSSAWNVKTVANNMALIITVSVVAAGVAVAGAMYLISKKRRLQK